MGVHLSYNRLCYRHNIDDPKCFVNPQYLRFYEGWATKGISVVGREELATHGNYFQPAEKVYSYLLDYYKKKGFHGTEIAIAPPALTAKRNPPGWRPNPAAAFLHAGKRRSAYQ